MSIVLRANMKKWITKIRDQVNVHVKWRKYEIGINFHAGRNVRIWARDSISIGDNVYIGRNSQIECNCVIGNNVLVANNVAFVGKYDHNYKEIGSPIRFSECIRDEDYGWKGLDSKIIVEDDVWIGYGAILVSGIVIERGSIIAAGSVVNRSVEAYSIVAGNPSKKIKNRFTPEEIELHEKMLYGKNYEELKH